MVSATCVFLYVVAFLTVVKRPVLALRPILILLIFITFFPAQWPTLKGVLRENYESQDQGEDSQFTTRCPSHFSCLWRMRLDFCLCVTGFTNPPIGQTLAANSFQKHVGALIIGDFQGRSGGYT